MAKTTASIAIILALIGMGLFWFISRPTPEESALREFFREFRLGHYAESERFTYGNDFYNMAASTSVVDTDGAKYLIGNYFPESRKDLLRFSIETYVRSHIARWEYHEMSTQKLGENSSVVKFRLEIGIRDFNSGEILGEVYSGNVEGTAFMIREENEWKIQKFDLYLFSDNGLILAPYLKQAKYS